MDCTRILRPSALVALRAEDVFLPVAGASRYRSIGVVVAPRELEVTTKTKAHDDTVLVDSACQPACGDILRELVRIRAEGDRLFPPFTLNSYEKVLRDAAGDLKLAELEIAGMQHGRPRSMRKERRTRSLRRS